MIQFSLIQMIMRNSGDNMYEAVQNVDGYVIPIKADVTLSVEELKKIAFQLGADSFKEEYCERY